MARFADIAAIARATVGHIIRYISGGAVNEMPNRQYLDFAGNCTVSDDGTGIRVTVPEVPAGSVTVGNVATLPAGSMAYVKNTGTPIHAILDFGIPRGAPSTDIVPILFGGTGADTAEGARQNLSVPSIADLQAVDNSAVHIAGTETITGAKTFSEAITGDLIGDVSGNAGTASKLETARSLQVDLASSTAVTFDGSADQNAIPVTGTLSVSNGGTGLTSLDTFVRTTSDQTIAGTKTLTSSPVVKNNGPVIYLQQMDVTKGTNPSDNQVAGIYMSDSTGGSGASRTGQLTNHVSTAGLTSTMLYAYQFASGSTDVAALGVFCSADGSTKYAVAPTPAANANDTKIATTSWVRTYHAAASTSSDENIKQDIQAIPDSVLDAWGEVNWQQFRYTDAVEEKGHNNARLHTGAIVQRVQEAFERHGLDATAYGAVCLEHIDASVEFDDDGNEINAHPARDVWGLRYNEALVLEAAYHRRRADRLEARIAAIEAKLNV